MRRGLARLRYQSTMEILQQEELHDGDSPDRGDYTKVHSVYAKRERMLNADPEYEPTCDFLVVQIIAPLRRSMVSRTMRLQTASLFRAIDESMQVTGAQAVESRPDR